MKGPCDYFQLMRLRQSHKVHGISRDSNRQLWIIFWMIVSIKKGLTIEDIYIEMLSSFGEIPTYHTQKIFYLFFSRRSK